MEGQNNAVNEARFTALEGKITTYETDLKAEKTKREEAERELKTFRAEADAKADTARITTFSAKKNELVTRLEVLVKDKKLAPAIRDELLADVDAQAGTFSVETGLTLSVDKVLKFAEAISPKLSKGEEAHGEGKPAGTNNNDPGDELAEKIGKFMQDNPKVTDYGEAMTQVLILHADLAKRYEDFNLSVEVG